MAALEYEVRDEYKNYTVAQLLESPVTCFQGVGEIQSEILQRYFKVNTVKELANFEPFLQALRVQETVLEGGSLLNKSVEQLAQSRDLGFSVRPNDQTKLLSELPESPVHVLEGLTPGQDLALYDAFRITNLTHLAHNRIMLEARVIDYLSEHGADTGEEGGGSDAVTAILGARAAATSAAQDRARSGDFEEGHRIQALAGELTDHVRDRVAAMRGRTRQRAAAPPRGAGAMAGAAAVGTGMSRMDTIRDSRARGTAGRGEARGRARAGTASSRTEEILASRGAGAGPRDVSRSVADRRRSEVSSGERMAGGSRAESVLAARQLAGRGGPPQAAAGGATVRSRAAGGAAAAGARSTTATATRPGAAEAGAGAAAGAGAVGGAGEAETTLRTEEEAAAAAGTGGAPARRTTRRPPPPNYAPLIAAAVIALLILAGLIWFLVSRGGPEETTTTAGAPGMEQPAAGTEGTQPGAESGTAGVPGTQPGAESGTAGAPGTAATATGPGTAPPPAIKATHVVRRGDSLWFISEREYADPLNWPSIFMENQDRIDHPDLIFPRQELRIPSTPEYRFPQYPEGYKRIR